METLYFWKSEAAEAAKDSASAQHHALIWESVIEKAEACEVDRNNPVFDIYERTYAGKARAFEVGGDKFGWLYDDEVVLPKVNGALVNPGNDPAIADWTNVAIQREAAELWLHLSQLEVLTPADGENWRTACRRLDLKPSQARKIYCKSTTGGDLYLCLAPDWA